MLYPLDDLKKELEQLSSTTFFGKRSRRVNWILSVQIGNDKIAIPYVSEYHLTEGAIALLKLCKIGTKYIERIEKMGHTNPYDIVEYSCSMCKNIEKACVNGYTDIFIYNVDGFRKLYTSYPFSECFQHGTIEQFKVWLENKVSELENESEGQYYTICMCNSSGTGCSFGTKLYGTQYFQTISFFHAMKNDKKILREYVGEAWEDYREMILESNETPREYLFPDFDSGLANFLIQFARDDYIMSVSSDFYKNLIGSIFSKVGIPGEVSEHIVKFLL